MYEVRDRLKALEKELQSTKIALAGKTMILDALETLIEKSEQALWDGVKVKVIPSNVPNIVKPL